MAVENRLDVIIEPWKLPNYWEWIPLDEICDIVIGGTPSRNNPKYWGFPNTWVSISDLNDELITSSKEQITDLGVANSNVKLIKPGTVLMSFKLTIGKLGIAGKELYTNEAIAALPIKANWRTKFDKDFLFYVLKVVPLSNKADLSAKGKTLNKKKIAKIAIPIPYPQKPDFSLDIQHRIVTRLETLLAEVKESRSLLEELRQDTKRLIYIALEEVFKEIVSCYPLELLQSHVVHLTSGSRGWSKYASPTHHGSLFIKVGNVGFSRIDLSEVERLNLPPNTTEAVRAKVVSGDVLVTITGTIGRCCVVPDNLGEAYVNQHVALIRLKESLEPRYLMWFILSPSGGGVQTTAMQYGQTKPGLSLTNIRNLSLSIPKQSVQRQIVAYLDKIQHEVDEILKLLEQDAKLLDMLEQSILERAFRGEL